MRKGDRPGTAPVQSPKCSTICCIDTRWLVQQYQAMSSRMSGHVVRRPSLPLTAQDESDLALLRSSPAFRQALAELSPSAPSPVEQVSESVLLHAVFRAGLSVVLASAEDEGYAELAIEYADRAGNRRQLSRRRSPAWVAEA